MKILRALVLTALSAAAVSAADVVPAFNATLTVGKESRFVLLDGNGKASSWLKVGDTFDGYTVKAYDPKAAALDLEKDGTVTRVSLATDAKVAEGAAVTPATVADATAVLDRMHFEQMLDRTLAAARKQQLAMVERMSGQMNRPGVDKADVAAFQKKVIETLMAGINGADLKDDVAKIYSQTFSKEELQGLADFYASPVGETFAQKQPELAEKMNQVIVPRIMANMPKVQQMAQEFAAQQKAKQAAAAAGGAAPVPGLASPAAPAPAGTPSTGKE